MLWSTFQPMKSRIAVFLLSLASVVLNAQTAIGQNSRPQIGSDTAELTSKLITLKNALPDLIRKFGTDTQAGAAAAYKCNLDMGKAAITLKKKNGSTLQVMEIDFDPHHYAGSRDDFRAFFNWLVHSFHTILGNTYAVSEPQFNADLGELESVSFFDKRYFNYNSPILIELDNFNKNSLVHIRIETERKPN